MKHAARKTGRGSVRRPVVWGASPTSASMGHARRAKKSLAGSAVDGAAVESDPRVADALEPIVPRTRRSIRLTKRAAARRSRILTSTSLTVLVGAAASVMVFGNPQASVDVADARASATVRIDGASDPMTTAASRSEERLPLLSGGASASDGGAEWRLGIADTAVDVGQMSRSIAGNPVVAAMMDGDAQALPAGFDPNHATGDSGNAYAFSECTWWVYLRRHELGLPAGSHMGNGNMWANSARSLGYWVDNTPRHVGDVMVFAAGQHGADSRYGHVAIVERINADGSIETSECGAVMNGKTYSRTFSAFEVGQFEYIHY